MTSTNVAVYLETKEGQFKLLTKATNRNRLIHFSELAGSQLKNGGPGNPRLPKGAVTLARGAADEKVALKLIKWIEASDLKNPTQVTLTTFDLEHFDEIVITYATAYAFRLKRELRGDDLRNAIYDYMHQGSLRTDEFAMVVEWLGFDGGLVKTALHEVCFRWCKGGTFTPPEMDGIEQYCKKVGMYEGMLKVSEDISKGMEAKDRREEARAKAKRDERFEKDFPTLR